eukprot:GEMP01007745.1.p1 GENE.GEMP01007745.1~~GEMP01007745.1.p1  ORF type:complete len:879 (+),score=127.11 GEMP01007745.1:90-2726(+)
MVLRALSFACTWADAYHTRTLGNADAYHTSPTGEPGTMDDRVDFSSHVDARSAISPWHGIPFKSKDGFYHFVCEIPKGATEKMEEIDGNPIKQDTKKYANGTEYVRYITYGGGALANYGYLTQTWENPNVTHDNHFGTLGQGVPGDGDPVGVLVLDDAPCKIGDVFTVWLLGGLALLGDSNERDWKLLAARQGQLKPSDYEEQVAAVREWFTSSKGNDTDGNPMHEVFVEINAEDADKVALDTHEQWAAQTHERRDAPKSTDDPSILGQVRKLSSAAPTTQITDIIGRALFLNTHDLMDISAHLAGGTPLFQGLPPWCYTSMERGRAWNTLKSMSSREEIFRELQAETGLSLHGSTAAATFSGTLKAHFSRSTEESSAYRAVRFTIGRNDREITFVNNCFNITQMNPRVLRVFELLPITFSGKSEVPNMKDFGHARKDFLEFWSNYNHFLYGIGSHLIRSVTIGARVQIFFDTTSTKFASTQEIEATACVEVKRMGVGDVGTCGNVTTHLADSMASELQNRHVVIDGGSDTARNALNEATTHLNEVGGDHTLFSQALSKFLGSSSSGIGTIIQVQWIPIWVYLHGLADLQDNPTKRQEWKTRAKMLELFYTHWFKKYKLPACQDGEVRDRCLCAESHSSPAVCKKLQVCDPKANHGNGACHPSCSHYTNRGSCERANVPCSWDDLSRPQHCVYVRYTHNRKRCTSPCTSYYNGWTTWMNYYCWTSDNHSSANDWWSCSLPGYTYDQRPCGAGYECGECYATNHGHGDFVCRKYPSSYCSPQTLQHGEQQAGKTKRLLRSSHSVCPADRQHQKSCVLGGILKAGTCVKVCGPLESCDTTSFLPANLCVNVTDLIHHGDRGMARMKNRCLGEDGVIPFNV